MTRTLRLLLPICLGCMVLASCGELLPSGQVSGAGSRSIGNVPKATGEVEVKWMGGGSDAPAGEEKRAYAALEWFDGGTPPNDRGQFRYVVYDADGTLHREIIAELSEDPRTGVSVGVENAVARFVGVVTFDSRRHDIGEEEATAEGGCADEHEEGDCSGEEGEGCSGHSDGEGGPAHPPGKVSRVGEIVAVVVHDGGAPQVEADTIGWSWFYWYEDPAKPPKAAATPEIGKSTTWPDELCTKPILGGNIVVHTGSHR